MSTTSEPPVEVPVFVFADLESRLADRARLRGLRDLGFAVGGRSESLDRITRLAAIGTEAVVSLVALVDEQRQFFPGAYGLPEELEAARETPLSRSLCQFVVINDAPLLISDVGLHEDLRRKLPGLSPDVAAYAGYPLHDPYGNVLGALCVVDSSPHYWAPQQLAVLEDLATRVEIELALRLRTREAQVVRGRLQRTIDAAASIAIVAADSEGVIVLANRGAEMLLDRRAKDLIGTKMAHLRRPGDPEGEWLIEDGAGGRRVVGVRHSVLLDDEGEIDGYLLIGEDMTARRAAEEELRRAGEEHEVLEHAKRDFVATASHELRTPLASVLGYTELLLDGAAGLLTSSQQRLVEPIERNGRRLFDLVEDILFMDQSHTGISAHTHRPVGLALCVRLR